MSGQFAFLNFKDSGAGIPDAVREKLFNPFFTTKEVGKGTGLGLSLSKGLMHDMGGDLELSPDPTQTCFKLKLVKS
jgi:C4-dicarboxylate-specific signal transduction histidine kinase